MAGLFQSLSRKRTIAEMATRQKSIDTCSAREQFLSVWLEQLDRQRDTARKTGKFKGAKGDGWNLLAGTDGFTLKLVYPAESGDIHIEGTWNRKTAKAGRREWTTP